VPPWGGSPDARMHFALSILDEIRNRIPENVPVGFRLILDEKTENGISTDEAIKFAKRLEQYGAAYQSATVGTYQSMFIPAGQMSIFDLFMLAGPQRKRLTNGQQFLKILKWTHRHI